MDVLRFVTIGLLMAGCGHHMARSELVYGYEGLACAPSDDDCREVRFYLDAIHGDFESWCGTVRVSLFTMLVRMDARAVPSLERALDLDGYAYSHTAAAALRSIGATATIQRWCARNPRAESRSWICTDPQSIAPGP